MECSESNKREQIIKSYAQYVDQNPETSKEIIHIGLSAKSDKKYLNIPINELQKSQTVAIPDEIVKENIILKKYSLNHDIRLDGNSDSTILFPKGSSLFYNNLPNVCMTSKDKNNLYTFTFFIQTENISITYSYQKHSVTTTPPPSFIFNTDTNKKYFYIKTNSFFTYHDSILRCVELREIQQGCLQDCYYTEGNIDDPKKLPITKAIGITKNSKFILFSLTQNDKHFLKLNKKEKRYVSNLTPFTTFTPITPYIFAGCTTDGNLYFIEIKSTTKKQIKTEEDYGTTKVLIHKQHLPKNILVKKISSNPLCSREFVFVAEKTIKDENSDNKKTEIILYHAYIDPGLTKESKIYFSEIEKLNKVPDHLGFHEDYVTISNTYSDTSTDKEKDFGIEVRNIPLTKRWLYLAGKLKNKEKTP